MDSFDWESLEDAPLWQFLIHPDSFTRGRYHPVRKVWTRYWETEEQFYWEVQRIMIDRLPTHIPEDLIKRIQVEEASSIESMSLDELSTRIETIQRASRELHVREFVVRKKLSDRLHNLTDEEVNKYVKKVPAAEGEFRTRQERKQEQNKGVRKPKGRPKTEDRLDALKLTNPAFQAFLDTLSPAKK